MSGAVVFAPSISNHNGSNSSNSNRSIYSNYSNSNFNINSYPLLLGLTAATEVSRICTWPATKPKPIALLIIRKQNRVNIP